MIPAVSFHETTISYNGHPAVDAVSFEVAEGEWLAVVGPNGAGKSSLLRSLVGGTMSGGSASLRGNDVASLRARDRAHHVAYVPQRPVFPVGMSVIDYVLLGRTPHLGPLAAESKSDIEIVRDALAELDLVALAERDVSSLSGGETQRASMARAIAQQAPILVLDEATAALDVARQHEVLELVDRIRKERRLAIVSAMHDLTAAAQFCDAIALLDSGKLRAVGPPRDVLTEGLLRTVFEPSVRVLDIEGSQVIVSMRSKEQS